MNQATETGNYNSWQGEKSNKIDSKMAQMIELLDNDFENWILTLLHTPSRSQIKY